MARVGGGAGDTASMIAVTARESEAETASVTVTVNEKVPAKVGTPLRRPLTNVRPSGAVPAVIANEYGWVPESAVNWAL